MNRKELQASLQMRGMSRKEARRLIYGPSWKEATRYGTGVQRAITKAEKARREALHGSLEREAEARSPEGEAGVAG